MLRNPVEVFDNHLLAASSNFLVILNFRCDQVQCKGFKNAQQRHHIKSHKKTVRKFHAFCSCNKERKLSVYLVILTKHGKWKSLNAVAEG